MSKNFELMQQIEIDRKAGDDSASGSSTTARSKSFSRSAQGQSPDAEALRLVQQLFLLPAQEPPHVVILAGIEHGNGCSRVSASVAIELAKAARKTVCLVEGNFHSPSLSAVFGTQNRVGLTTALVQSEPLSSLVQSVGQENLWLLPSGPITSDSYNLLNSRILGERIDELRKNFDFVIIDAPPISQYWDAITLGQLADGLVLVIEANSTHRETASSAADKVHAANIPLLAAVLNKRTYPIPKSIFRRI